MARRWRAWALGLASFGMLATSASAFEPLAFSVVGSGGQVVLRWIGAASACPNVQWDEQPMQAMRLRSGEQILPAVPSVSRVVDFPVRVCELAWPQGVRKALVGAQQILVNTFRARQGNTVFSGPFAGMHYASNASEGALMPRLIGCYEAELHPFLAQVAQAGYERVIDIGCAEGYYAVGLARMLPGCHIHAHDIDESAQQACRQLAQANGVADRVTVAGVFEGAQLARHTAHKTLIVCDIEGAEAQLLDPRQWPDFARFDLLVEVHECFQPGLVRQLDARFAATHTIEWVWPSVCAHRELPPWVQQLSHLDQLLCIWEWRQGPTPWAIMRSRTAL